MGRLKQANHRGGTQPAAPGRNSGRESTELPLPPARCASAEPKRSRTAPPGDFYAKSLTAFVNGHRRGPTDAGSLPREGLSCSFRGL